MTARQITLGLAGLVLIAAAWHRRALGDGSGTATTKPESNASMDWPLGNPSCAAAACHGNPAARSLTAAPDRQCWQSSLTHFLAVDPHRRAFEVLHNELSKQITAGLRKGATAAIPDAPNDPRCLACHTNPSLAFASIPVAAIAERRLGVGCEACHGNAGSWRAVHTAWTADTRGKGITETSFRDLNSLPVRAETCAGCHVGAPAAKGLPARDMNHDMIAAGHPALPDDLTALMNRYPRHWFERDRTKANQPERKLDAEWTAFLERAKSAAAEGLKRERKTRADGRTPWPELSETKCTDCHRKIPAGSD